MNYQLVSKYLGHFLLATALLMLPSALWAIWFQEWVAFTAFCESIALTIACGLTLWFLGRNAPSQMFQREALTLVAFGWFAIALVGAFPYVLAQVLDPVGAFFESTSGFTTTGASVLTDIESVHKSILFWRSFTHWIGGMGIIVLFVAVLPYLGVGGKQLFRSESSGPDPRGLSPRIRDTATILYRLYVGLTILQTLLLMVAGMSFYDALCHTFGTLASGGFSTRNLSVAAYDSVMIELIIIVFMVVAGTNFGLFYAMLKGEYREAFQNTEWRVYLFIMIGATAVITANLLGMQGQIPGVADPATPDYTASNAFRQAAFQVVSLMTTTGFCSDNYEVWPHLSRMVLVLIMIVGGSAGSTSGGLKVIRVVLLLKIAGRRLELLFRPKRIRAIQIDGQAVDEEIVRGVCGFFVLYGMVLAAGSLCMAAVGLPFESAVSSVITTMNGVGPGLQFVGAVENFAFIPDSGKLILCLCMLLGRLELFTLAVMVFPSFWKHA